MLSRRHLQVPEYEVIFALGAELPESPDLLRSGVLAWLNLLHNASICFSIFLVVQLLKCTNTYTGPSNCLNMPAVDRLKSRETVKCRLKSSILLFTHLLGQYLAVHTVSSRAEIDPWVANTFGNSSMNSEWTEALNGFSSFFRFQSDHSLISE